MLFKYAELSGISDWWGRQSGHIATLRNIDLI